MPSIEEIIRPQTGVSEGHENQIILHQDGLGIRLVVLLVLGLNLLHLPTNDA